MMRVVLILLALLVAAPALAQELERVPPITNEVAKEECGACHMAYQPQFLPAESWRRIFADLGDHFGEDASLDDPVRQEVLDFYVAHAGRAGAGQAPLRISELRWWVDEHREIRDAEWSRAKFKGNCTACHRQAEQGLYEED